MENEKRKLQANGGGGGEGRRTKARGDNGGEQTATEAEVEEFFAILRQLHSAVRQFHKDNGDVVVVGGRTRNKITTSTENHNNNTNNNNNNNIIIKGSSWKPVFEWGDFEEIKGLKERTEIDRDGDGDGDGDQNQNKKEERVEENLGHFDLNAEPESDS